MKRYAILTLALAICGAMLVGCGCMNSGADVTTLPTNGETSMPATRPTTAPTTMPTTAPATMPTTLPETQETEVSPTDTTGALEGAIDDITGNPPDSTDTATTETGPSRGRSQGAMPRG